MLAPGVDFLLIDETYRSCAAPSVPTRWTKAHGCGRVPLNVTHLAIVSSPILSRLHSSTTDPSGSTPSKPGTPLRHTLSTLINFFADAYRTTFGFAHGPPLHDALAVMFVSRPDLFTTRRFRVDIELAGAHTAGETVVDVWSYRQTDDTWGPNGKNCIVAESLDVRVSGVGHLQTSLMTPHRCQVSSTSCSSA
jgi:inosine-uridine nucleoside N-ribohydrolase